LLVPVETIGTKGAQRLMERYGAEILLLDKRVNFRMPQKGWGWLGCAVPDPLAVSRHPADTDLLREDRLQVPAAVVAVRPAGSRDGNTAGELARSGAQLAMEGLFA
jgi:hypothetical protein